MPPFKSSTSGSEKNSSIAWQAGIGSRIKIMNNLFADICIQHMDLGKFDLGDIVIKEENDVITTEKLRSTKVTNEQITLSISLFLGSQSEPSPSLL